MHSIPIVLTANDELALINFYYDSMNYRKIHREIHTKNYNFKVLSIA